jgi:integrase
MEDRLMSVRKEHNKDRKWTGRWIADTRRVVHGRKTGEQRIFSSKKDAAAYEVAHKAGIGKPKAKRDGIGFIAYCNELMDVLEGRGRRRSTVTGYRWLIRDYFIPFFEDKKLIEIDQAMISGWRNELEKTGKKATAHAACALLKQVFKAAKEDGLLRYNEARDIRMPSRKKEKLVVGWDVPRSEEIWRLIEAAQVHRKKSTCLYPLLVTAVGTGMRAGELRGLTWDKIDFERGVIKVEQGADRWGEIGRTKTETGIREIPMMARVQQVLQEWREFCPRRNALKGFLTPEHNIRRIAKVIEEQPGVRNTELAKRFGVDIHAVLLVRRAMPIAFDNDLHLVFPTGNGTVISTQNVWMQLCQLQIDCGMVAANWKPKYSAHKLRHFFASAALQDKIPIKELQHHLGHKHASMTWDVYGHLFSVSDEEQKRMAALGERIFGPPVASKTDFFASVDY